MKLDHITVAGTNLDAMRAALAATVNLSAEYGGPHSNHATEMALVSFPDGSYLELIGIQAEPDPAAVAAHAWAKFLQTDAGPCAFALCAPDLTKEMARLKSAGIEIGALEPSGRARPDGTSLAWEAVRVGAGSLGSFFPFLIRDLTPRENRVFPHAQPTTERIAGVGKVVIGVRDLEDAIEQYRRAFALAAPHLETDAEFGAGLAWFEGTPIVLARGIQDSSWLSRRVDAYGDAPCAFVFTAAEPGSAQTGSNWFGRVVQWADESQLGWRLGIER